MTAGISIDNNPENYANIFIILLRQRADITHLGSSYNISNCWRSRWPKPNPFTEASRLLIN